MWILFSIFSISFYYIINSLSPNIQKQILPTDLYTFPERMCSENLMKDQSIFFLVIILLILIT